MHEGMVPDLDDWSRFLHHARRVRMLDMSRPWLPRTDDPLPYCITQSCWNALQTLEASINGPILPNLQEIVWKDNNVFPFLRLFIQPSLRSLNLKAMDNRKPNEVMAMVHTLKTCGASLTALRRFTLKLKFRSTNALPLPALDILSSLVCTFRCLVSVTINAILSDDALCHLAVLPTLKSLALCIDHIDYSSSPLARLKGAKFAALTSTVITTVSQNTTPITSFLEIIASPLLRSVEIYSGYDDKERGVVGSQPKASYLQRLFVALGKISTLTTVKLHPCEFHHDTEEFIVGEDTLLPLFSLTNIRHLDLTNTPIKLSAASVKRAAKSWPRAVDLELGVDSIVMDASDLGVAVEDLVPFAIHCPQLRSLGIRITHSRHAAGDGAVLSRLISPQLLPHSKLLRLKVDERILNKKHDGFIALFLAYVFPRTEVLRSENDDEENHRRRFDRLNTLKNAAVDLLEARVVQQQILTPSRTSS